MKIHEIPNFLPSYPDYIKIAATNFYFELEKILSLDPNTPSLSRGEFTIKTEKIWTDVQM